MKTEEFNLSEKIIATPQGFKEKKIEIIEKKDVKEFIKRQIEKIDWRLIELDEFDGLAETMLQKAELQRVKEERK